MKEISKGRPLSENARRNRLAIRLNDNEYEQLKEIADKKNTSASEVIRELIKDLIKKGK